MAKSSTDRRIARTRATLQQALTSLTLKKGYDAITITDICDAANVGRSTFYAHYTSKDDLKRNGMQHLRKLLADQRKTTSSVQTNPHTRKLGFSLTMFEHARDHKDLYRALVGSRGGTLALGVIRQILTDMVREELAEVAAAGAADAVPRDVAVRYLVGGYMSVLTWWLDAGAKLAPERVDAMFRHLALEGVMPR